VAIGGLDSLRSEMSRRVGGGEADEGGEEGRAGGAQSKAKESAFLERVVIESVCALTLLVLSGAAVSIFSISPLLPQWRSYGATTNALLFVSAVMGAYLAFRVYFGVSYWLLSWVESAVPLLSSSPHRKTVGRGYITAVTVMGVTAIYFSFPQFKQALYTLAMDALGDLPDVLSVTMDTEYKRVHERATKMAGLFVGWFIFFFVFELLVRVVLAIFIGLGGAVLAGIRSGESTKKEAK